ncbi:hypothetical protein QWY97_20350 [Vibrio cortegadensis]|uniref:hypothetical protein n=1 Tax=Vibrio cortegadensis TaxID=1328770 RepID=UPI0021C36B9D|nr:hypothetical protein [Vibrio cortegadensis]MDN3699660.1 hypothetical protein [Vibrio cortegadensis]
MIARVNGWAYYSFIVARGAVIYLLSYFLCFAFPSIYKYLDFFLPTSLLEKVTEFLKSGEQYDSFVYLVAVLISLVFVFLSQILYSNKFIRLNLIAKLVESDSRRGFILEAIATSNPILISMNSRKCYVGICLGEDFTNYEHQCISILPLLSGYRDDKKLTLNITTNNYSHFVESDILSESSIINQNDFKLIVSMQEIESIQFFSMGRYKNEELGASEKSD